MGALSKLDAVNRILRSAGEYPVSTLSVTGSNDVTIAVQTLDETVLFIQLAGLNNNTEVKNMLPDSSGRIVIPDNVISVDTISTDIHRNVVTRGRSPTYLFDIDNNTDVFEVGKELKVRIVYALDFESLSTPEQFQAVDMAARSYQMATVGDIAQDKLLAEQSLMSRVSGRAHNIRSMDASFINNKKTPWPWMAARRTFGPY
jgi:hypothetical protein